jgi:hypothetical protein
VTTGQLAEQPVAPLSPAGDVSALDRRVYVVAAAVCCLLMAASTRYGFDRDEFYFLDCGRHLSLSYVDQPVFTPLLARLSLDLFGVSLVGLRLWPSLAAAGTVVLGALLAREFGGGRAAQLLAALGAATAPALLGADHIMGPTAFDLLAWSALAYFVARIGRTGDVRLWAPAGLVLGIGLANKHSIGFFAVALIVGTVISGGARQLTNRWFVAGFCLAALCTVPDLWWQAHHGWATVEMTRRLGQENGGLKNAVTFIPSQLVMASPALIWVWLAGLGFLWRSGRPLWRAFAWSYGLLFVLFAATAGAKPYYLGGAYVFLLAAGAVRVEGRLAEAGQWRRTLIWTAVAFVVTLPIVLPVLPARDIGFVRGLNATPAETVGWPELVHTVHAAWFDLPVAQRTDGVIFTSNYGEAGAINELGRGDGLPEAVSGHNTLWFFGPGNPGATTVLAVVLDNGGSGRGFYDQYLRPYFGHIRAVATISNRPGLANQESGGHVYVCTDPVHRWGALWVHMRHDD